MLPPTCIQPLGSCVNMLVTIDHASATGASTKAEGMTPHACTMARAARSGVGEAPTIARSAMNASTFAAMRR